MPCRATMLCSSLNRDPQRRPRRQPGEEREATWQPIDNTPLHPEYPCAHCIESGAAVAVIESVLGSTDIPEVLMTSSTAPVNVQRQVRAVCLFSRTSMSHRRSSSARRNPMWLANARSSRCAAPVRLRTTALWRDKRGAPGGSQAVDMAWLPPGASVGSRAARRRKMRFFKPHSGTDPRKALPGPHL
jgi:hypothetical protein